MKDRHVTERLPLWVGGDLTSRESESVAAHLVRCAPCRAEAAALQQSRAWTQAGMASPFTAEDRAAFRRETLGRIREESAVRRASHSPRRFRPLLMVAASALLLVVALRWMRAGNRMVPPLAVPPSPVARIAPDSTLPSGQPQAHPRPVRVRSRSRPVPAAPDMAFTRLELQTADPSIRIIWLAQATPVASLPAPSNP